MSPLSSSGGLRLASFGLGLWAVGLFTQELFAIIGMVATVLGAAVLGWTRRDLLPDPRASLRTWWPLAAFFLMALLGPLLGGRLPGATGLARHLEWLLLPLVAWTVAQLSGRQRRRLVAIALVTLTLSSLAAALQHWGIWPSSEAFRPWAWTRTPFDRVYEPAPGAEGRFLAGGLVFHRLKYAHVGALAVAAFAAWSVEAKGRDRWVLIAAAVFNGVAIILFPAARAAAAALLAGTAVALVVARRPTLRTGLAGAAVLGLIALAAASYTPVRTRLLSSFDREGSGARTTLLMTGVTALREAPLTGQGLGRFRAMDFLPPDAPSYTLHHPGKSHNQLLSMAAETGIPGGLLFLVLIALLLARLWRQRAAAAVGGLVIFVLLSMTHDPLFHPQFALALFLLVGASLGARGRVTAAPAPAGTPQRS
ncbi:MAG: O-antigen ligase family protein [Myxococcota bacterium]|nr:O-antigen ligase family protein [Myxococcota bacterium]